IDVDLMFVNVFFFSSRRRHTRSKRDWSSDVCSSDLGRDPRDHAGISGLRSRQHRRPGRGTELMSNLHTLSVLTQDEDGIISRISGMFTRRAFNIVSISSGRTEIDGVNRITLVVEGEEIVVEQITKQLNKLVPVLKVSRQDPETTVQRGLLLVKVAAGNSNRTQV